MLCQEAGALSSDQAAQLASARHSLVSKMQQHVVRRAEIARLVQSGGQTTAEDQQPLLGNIAQVRLPGNAARHRMQPISRNSRALNAWKGNAWKGDALGGTRSF